MLKPLRYFWKEHPLALGAFLAAMALIVFFGIRFALGFVYFQDPSHRDEELEPWMTPKYVAMSYRLPREIIREVFQLEGLEGRRVTLEDITEQTGISIDEYQRRVWAAKATYRPQNGRAPQSARENIKERLRKLRDTLMRSQGTTENETASGGSEGQ